MLTLAKLPYELKESIADCAYEDGLAQLSSVNREGEQICSPKIWQLQFGESDEVDEVRPFRMATPPGIIRHALPKHCWKQLSQYDTNETYERRQEVEICCCSPTDEDIDLLYAALHFVEPNAIEIRATDADRVSKEQNPKAPYSCKLLRRLFGVLACHVATTGKLDIEYSVERGEADKAAELLDSLYRSAEECFYVSCHMGYDTPKENVHAVLATILGIPSLIILVFVCDDLTGFSPDEPACQLMGLYLNARQLNELNVQANAAAVHRILKQHTTTLDSLALYNAFPRDATSFQKLPFPVLKDLKIAASTKTPAVFAFFDGPRCPVLEYIDSYGDERVLLYTFEDFISTLPLRSSLKIELPAFDKRWNNRDARQQLLAFCERQKVSIHVGEED